MSQHFIEHKKPPPGISSFTKIRLGWISPNQVLSIKPGETRCAFLSPLAEGDDTLAVKIPLKRGHYYLVENRQPVGFDRILPDSGILILRVNPKAAEGSGTVKVIDADPDSPHFSHATFRLDRTNRDMFLDKWKNLAVIPLWSEEKKQGVLFTNREKSADALKAASMIQKLMHRYPEPRGEKEKRLLKECVASFKSFDFEACYRITQQTLKGTELKR